MSERIESKIKEIKSDGNIIIEKIASNQKKDYICKKGYANLPEKDFSKLAVGTPVSFLAKEVEGNYYASQIKLIVQDESSQNQKAKSITTKTLADEFISSLRDNLDSISQSSDFEDFTLFILKSLGVSEIYPIPRDNAAGKADGLFKISSLSTNGSRLEVIYDCTLNSNWEEYKKTQLENYISQINQNSMTISYKLKTENNEKLIKHTIMLNANADKQIWIITKGKTKVCEKRQTQSGNNVIIKEINIVDLISIVKERYLDSTFSKVDEMADNLRYLSNKD